MIFLGGIHGVGKTSLLKEIETAYNVSIYSASGLISQLKDDEYVKNKYRASIIADQNILLRALNEFVKEKEYILDGHFCLLDLNGNITRIPLGVFTELPIKKIFILVANVDEIVERLYRRDQRYYGYELVQEFQESEILYAKEIAGIKNIDIEIISNKNKILEYLQGIQ